jgi:hypothetical protein
MTTRHKPSACLACGEVLDSSSRVENDDAKPGPGDVSICLYCHHVMVYADEALTLRNPTDEEIIDMAGDPSLLLCMRALGAFKQWEATRAAASRRAGQRGMVRAADRAPDELKLPQDRDAEGRAVETGGEVSLPADRRKTSLRNDG